MPVPADFSWRKSATMATSFSPTAIGGAMSSNPVTDALLGDVFFRMSSPALGAGVLRQHQKLFLYLAAAADGPLLDAKVYLENALDDLTANSKLRVSVSVGETANTKKLRAVGVNSAGVAVVEEKVLPATPGDLDWSTDWARLDRLEARLVVDGSYTTVAGEVTVKVEPTASPGSGYSTIGIIPASRKGATSEYEVFAEATLDTSTTNGTGNNCTVAPAGATFSKPRTALAGLLLANSGQVNAGTAAPIWVRWNLAEEAKGGQPLCCLRVAGGTA